MREGVRRLLSEQRHDFGRLGVGSCRCERECERFRVPFTAHAQCEACVSGARGMRVGRVPCSAVAPPRRPFRSIHTLLELALSARVVPTNCTPT